MVPRDVLWSNTFVELADTLVDEFDIIDLLTLLADRCTELFDADAAGILLADGNGVLRVLAASSEKARLLELFQLQNDQGPCLDCYSLGAAVGSSDLTAETRWPLFSAESVNAGLRAVHAFPLRLRSEVIGALNIFFTEPVQVAEADLTIAQSMADVATIAILQDLAARQAQEVTEQLQAALNSRITIEQAKGILAERCHTDMDHAFKRLRTFSRDHNRRLGVVAQEVVDGSMSTQDSAILLGRA